MTGREEYSEKKKGLIGTIVFHFIVLILLLFLDFFTPLPLPGEEGILVNFGNSDNGLGNQEPAPARRQKQNPAPPKTEEKKTTPPPVKTTPPPPVVSKSQPEPAKEVAMTQDYEKTVAINAAEKKKQEELEAKRKKEQEELKRRQEIEAERKRQEEIERKKQEEIDRQKREEEARLAREEAERKAKEEAERQRKAEEERRINEINSRTAGAFAKSGDGSGGEGSGTGKSQGVTFPGGNQGVPTGDPNADKYGPGGSGSGDSGSGVSFSLAGRSIKSIAKPEHPGGDSGKVVVKITVDRNGNVISALPGAPGTTISGQSFHNHAKQAALKTKFNVANDAPAHQSGTITYIFSYQ